MNLDKILYHASFRHGMIDLGKAAEPETLAHVAYLVTVGHLERHVRTLWLGQRDTPFGGTIPPGWVTLVTLHLTGSGRKFWARRVDDLADGTITP